MRIAVYGLLVSTLVITGCSTEKDSSTSSSQPHDSSTVRVETFEGRGVVKSVMPNREHIIVDHEDIPGFMSAMSMPFALKDTSLATGLSPGDSIRFSVEVDGPYIHLTRIDIEG